MAGDDLKQYASSQEDFYASLGVESTASEAEIRRAYRQTARKYHPDKVGAHNTAALEKFHQLQIAYDVLTDATVKELYDNARRAREEEKARRAAFDGRRQAMINELETREHNANKRKRDQASEEDKLERELQRLAEDGKRRRLAREEELRQEWASAQEAERKVKVERVELQSVVIDDIDRSITLRFQKGDHTAHYNQESLTTLFSRFGPVEAVVLKEKRRKPPGGKHKIDYWTGIILFKSIVGAHAAVSDFPTLLSSCEFQDIEDVSWAGGKEPAMVPKIPVHAPAVSFSTDPSTNGADQSDPVPNMKKTSDFSFKPSNEAVRSEVTPPTNDLLMMRLKNAEKRRLEAKQAAINATNGS